MIKREELRNPKSCMSRAKDDEMTFVLLGRDAAAPVAIRTWVQERIRLGKNVLEDPQIQSALLDATAMDGLSVEISEFPMQPWTDGIASGVMGAGESETVDEKVSAETGGEKAAHRQECQLAYITEEEARLKDYGCTCPPNFPRSSQNQAVSGGVEGAHEGITADKSELLPTQLPKEK